MSDADPHCPECGEPIGQTATYCMHCSADLTAEKDAADADSDGAWDSSGSDGGSDAGSIGETRTWGSSDEGTGGEPEPTYGPTEEGGGRSVTEASTSASSSSSSSTSTSADGQLLDPDGLVDNTLTVVVGIVGGIVVGIVGLIVTPIVTGSGWGVLVGLVAWLGSTAYLVRQRTVQGAVAKSGYAVAVVLLLIPLVAFSPLADVDGGLTGRGEFFLASLFVVAFPAGIAAAVGYVASRFVPEDAGETPA